MMTRSYWTRDRIVWTIVGIAVVIGLFWLLDRLSGVLLPFFAACLFAYLLNPVVIFFQTKVKIRNRLLAVIVTLLLVCGVMTGIGWLCAPMIASEIDTLSNMIERYSHHVYTLKFLPVEIREYIRAIDLSEFKGLLSSDNLMKVFSKGTDLVSRSLDSLFHILEWALMFIYIVFVLIDYDEMVRGFKKIFPASIRPKAMEIAGDVEKAMNSYFRGQGLVALCACVMYCIGFSLVGLPLALVMGLLVGILYMIPYFQYITLIPVGLICFITSLGGPETFWAMMGKCLLVYLVVQSVCDYILTPHIMGKEMGLNPAVILLALSVWGSLLGILGMIIALPATALIIAYYERYISNRGLTKTEKHSLGKPD
ncbi:MAG: AI-2E family transporter [Muribaculaceae bacterium]|nr:AI-2E family transporter [Muribaculaceae bacterium]